MNPLTIEWVDKAEGDFTTALRELRARKSPNYDAACFHAQQCVEKYLKARLQEAGIIFTKTHNLTVLLDLLLPVEPGYDSFRLKLLALTLFAVAYRYPGASAGKDTAREALDFCKEIRQEVRLSLGLNP
ncbi:HEPN domain-containing protein [Planktothrix sp. FACHB-1365]|uniref:HEPN domain-containing protein n=1 Tax=Planktothrix sp. FACHB-1365 TaxID=2692855 RepID=UPI001682A422|nr:HEPN domain-containing protein [Planktothrix sp. FACHB-1365]MBD2485703.1 HEPN domain-containing protein [Planktothrix sp. FACHB-1365]